MIALALAAAESGDPGEVFRRLHPFRRRDEAEAVGDADNGLDHGAATVIVRPAVDEGPVDLQLLDREAREIAERGEPRAEIIEGEPHAEGVKVVQEALVVAVTRHEQRLGDLQFQPAGGEMALGEGMGHMGEHPRLAELGR